MSQTRVVNIKKGMAYDIFIGRPGVWGNPYKIGKHGTREEVIALYRKYLELSPALMAAIPALKGQRLGCYCWPEACHGDVLVELAENHSAEDAK